MEFLTPAWHSVVLVSHIIGAVVGVGAVTVTDYFHLIGLKKKSLERKMLFVYPLLGRMVIWAIVLVTLTGIILLLNKPVLLQSSLFQLKMALFLVILINGFVLHKKVYPHVIKCVLNDKGTCPIHVLWISSISGTISVVTWYATLILALTKQFAYTVKTFLVYYFLALIVVFLIAYFNEEKARIWKN